MLPGNVNAGKPHGQTTRARRGCCTPGLLRTADRLAQAAIGQTGRSPSDGSTEPLRLVYGIGCEYGLRSPKELPNLNIRQLVEGHPEILQDRFELSFARGASPADVARALSRHGVVMLRGALPKKTLAPSRRTFERFARSLGKRQWSNWGWGEKDEGPDPEWAKGETDAGSWHKPWIVRHWNRRPAAAVISAMVESWAWPVVEEICGTVDIAVLLGLCLARHAIDVDLGVGAHQDAKGLPPMVPFSIWVPLHDVTPGSSSGLGFVVGPPDEHLADVAPWRRWAGLCDRQHRPGVGADLSNR